MRFRFLLSVVGLLAVGSARAAGYDEFVQGVTANALDDSATAVTAFSAAIAAADLSPSLLPAAYRARAVAYLRMSKCAEALPDLDKAIDLKAAYPDIRWLHARSAECIGRRDAAIADMTALLAADRTPAAYFTRGRLRWYNTDYSGAEADFVQARQIDQQDAYVTVWLEIARWRNGTLTADVAATDLDLLRTHAWPRAVVELYAAGGKPQEDPAAPAPVEANGGLDESQQVGAAAAPHRQCESDFYLGEFSLSRHDIAAAKPLLQHAADQCPPDALERDAARHELAALK